MRVVTCCAPVLRRCGYAALLASMMLISAGCAGHSSPGHTSPGHSSPGPTAALGADAGQVKITQVRVGGATPVEGALSYIRVERAAGATLIERRLPGDQQLTLKLQPGAYRLVSWQRICDGNCGHLDPPSDRCARPFTVRERQQLKATVRIDFVSGCLIALR